MPSSTDIIAAMPHPTLTAITGTPTFPAIRLLKQECFANAAAVEISLTAPELGHAALIIGVPAYQAIAIVQDPNYLWAEPGRPDPQPDYAAQNANNQGIAVAKNIWDMEVADWKTFNAVKTVLKQQILTAVPPEFVSSLKDDTTGFAAVTPLALIEHLQNMYGAVTRADLDKNLTALEAPWEPTDSMESLWTRCTQCEHIATAGGEPIQGAHKLRIMLKVLAQTGVFSLDVRDWNKRPVAERTWDHFKTFFANANRERCANMTAGDYMHQANAAHGGTRSGATSPTFSEITQGTMTSQGTIDLKNLCYCWTHGLYPNGNGHTGCECKYKKSGHQEDATVTNMMGGNNTIRRLQNEKNDYARLNPRNNGDKETQPPAAGDGAKKNRRGRGRGNQANVAETNTKASDETIQAVAAQVMAKITGQPIEE